MNLLQALTIEEISGVDSPANMLDGFLIAKAKSGGVQAVASTIRKERAAFRALLEQIRTADWTDERKVEATRKALAEAPAWLTVPVVKEAMLAARIRRDFGLDGSPAPARKDATPAPAPAAPASRWRHFGATLLR